MLAFLHPIFGVWVVFWLSFVAGGRLWALSPSEQFVAFERLESPGCIRDESISTMDRRKSVAAGWHIDHEGSRSKRIRACIFWIVYGPFQALCKGSTLLPTWFRFWFVFCCFYGILYHQHTSFANVRRFEWKKWYVGLLWWWYVWKSVRASRPLDTKDPSHPSNGCLIHEEGSICHSAATRLYKTSLEK